MKYSRNTWFFAALLTAFVLAPASLAGTSPGDVVDRFFGAYREASPQTMLSIYAPDAVFEDVNQRHHFEGTEQLGQMLGQLVAMHHSMDVREKRRVVDGDIVVVEYDYVGTLNGAVLGQVVGKEDCPDLEYALPVTSWYRIEDGRIAHQRDFVDWATFLELRQRMLAASAEN